ncbi:hypothetical protein KFL_002570190 [Klebsormidium nitens]|uniref:Protein kinase domain-containing protein n=1 Tax=Klebsormidium nitens TaxID=105231 RepID=A0A1Y1I9P8_KLENI|nr:hypothetical protein KFL_002570190 [Klebsormidium nitens]|eukprot:GAQ85851.1 hypothetical protein KFL_002570190 [Klebsormidium nitens]
MSTPAPTLAVTPPAVLTAAPVPTPVLTTDPPATTAAPTTAAPVTTPPVATTSAPTDAPDITTAAPVITTAAPIITTFSPVITTAAPFFTPPTPATNSPVATTAPPATRSPNVPVTPSPNVPVTPSPNVPVTPSPTSRVPTPPPLVTPVTPSAPQPPSNSGSESSSSLSTGTIIGIAAGGGALVVIVLLCLLWCCCRPAKKRRAYESPTRRQSQAALLKAAAQDNRQQNYAPSRTPPRDNFGPLKPPPQQQLPAIQREQRAPPQNEWANENQRQQWKAPPPLVAPSSKAPSEPKSQPESPAMVSPLQAPPRPPSAFGDSHRLFTYEELRAATNNFSPTNLLGEGGFGKVFKGVTSEGVTVAVKQLTLGGLGGQGEREFRSEVEVISRVHHRHLVTLLGYCMKGEERLLVLEYMANGTLESNLHGKNQPLMDWASRKKVAVGSARGLAYLHEDCHPRIIHRDIKASNILMDEHFDAQVADFGLAKLAGEKDTHVTTRVMGTFGYLAPEYAMSGKLTEKSDVFSFGVVLLELISGRRPVDMSQPAGQESLVEWARPILMREQYDELVDPRLNASGYDPDEMHRFIRAAMLCIRSTATKRPRMTQVVRMLEDDGLSPDSTSNYQPTQRFDSVPFGGGPYMSSEFGSEAPSSGEYSQSSQGGYPSGPAAALPMQGRSGGSYRSEASGPHSAEVALDIIDEHREPQREVDPYGDQRWDEDEETGMGRPAQVQLAHLRPTSSGSSVPPPPGRQSRSGSLTPTSPGMLRPPPGRPSPNPAGYGQPPGPRRSSRGSSDEFKQSQYSQSSSGSEYTSGQMGGSAYGGNTIVMPERFDGEGR